MWEVVIPPTGSNVLHNKWIFKAKTNENDYVERYKARLVACGNEKRLVLHNDFCCSDGAQNSQVDTDFITPIERAEDVPNAYVNTERNRI